MRLKLQKRRVLKFVSRIILHKQGMIPHNLLRNLSPELALVVIPAIALIFLSKSLCVGIFYIFEIGQGQRNKVQGLRFTVIGLRDKRQGDHGGTHSDLLMRHDVWQRI